MGRALRSAHEMEGLPSERSSMSGASKLLGRLADRASAEIVFPYSNLEWQRRKYQEALSAGREPEMTYAVRPGAFVERLGPEDREVLCDLRSEDAEPVRIDRRHLDFLRVAWPSGVRACDVHVI